jgi:hypothetical protein
MQPKPVAQAELLGNLAHDRQPQAAAIHIGAQHPIKAVEHERPLALGDARAGVLHFQESRAAAAAHAYRDGGAGRGLRG